MKTTFLAFLVIFICVVLGMLASCTNNNDMCATMPDACVCDTIDNTVMLLHAESTMLYMVDDAMPVMISM